jgi:hypothetical protein
MHGPVKIRGAYAPTGRRLEPDDEISTCRRRTAAPGAQPRSAAHPGARSHRADAGADSPAGPTRAAGTSGADGPKPAVLASGGLIDRSTHRVLELRVGGPRDAELAILERWIGDLEADTIESCGGCHREKRAATSCTSAKVMLANGRVLPRVRFYPPDGGSPDARCTDCRAGLHHHYGLTLGRDRRQHERGQQAEQPADDEHSQRPVPHEKRSADLLGRLDHIPCRRPDLIIYQSATDRNLRHEICRRPC